MPIIFPKNSCSIWMPVLTLEVHPEVLTHKHRWPVMSLVQVRKLRCLHSPVFFLVELWRDFYTLKNDSSSPMCGLTSRNQIFDAQTHEFSGAKRYTVLGLGGFNHFYSAFFWGNDENSEEHIFWQRIGWTKISSQRSVPTLRFSLPL